jgi:hypothetical protein
MDDLVKSIKDPSLGSLKEKRRDRRTACFIEANYLVQTRWHKGAIRNISDGGAHISSISGGRFFPGEDIFLVAQIKSLHGRVRGRIVWVGLKSMGIEFHTGRSLQSEFKSSFFC